METGRRKTRVSRLAPARFSGVVSRETGCNKLLRLKFELSSSEFAENDQHLVRSAVVITRMSGFEHAPV
eukprot:6834661-Heterocapsa_arctica.AAC.1